MHGFDDFLISCAPADVAINGLADLVFCGCGVFFEEGDEGHQETRGAKTALQRVFIGEGLLQRVQVFRSSKRFHGANFVTVSLNRENKAGADGFAIEEDGAGTANAMLAAHMSSQQTQVMAQEIT